jgi:NitT/TauT family transport system permease protein
MSTVATTRATSRRFAGLWPRATVRLRIYQIVFAILVFGFWQYASGRLIDSFWVSSPTAVALWLWDGFSSGYLISHCLVTFWEAGLGFAIGAVAGIITGLILAVAETPRRILDPYFMAVYGMPRIALAPLFIIWFGIGTTSKVVLVVIIVFLLVFYNTYQGVLNAPANLMRLVRVLGASEHQVWTKVILPSASPWILTGLRISVPQALVGAVVGEFISAERGLGVLVQQFSSQLAIADAFAVILMLMFLGLLLYGVMEWLERTTVFWLHDARLVARSRRRAARAQRKLARGGGVPSGPQPTLAGRR